MALTGADLSSGSPTAQHAQLLEEKTAAKKAIQQQSQVQFPANNGAQDLAMQSEAYLDPSERHRAEQQRARVSQGANLPENPQPGSAQEDSDAGTDESEAAWMEMQQSARESSQWNDPVTRVKQRGMQQQLESAALAVANNPKIISAANSSLTTTIQELGYQGLTFVDFGISFTLGSIGTIIQMIATSKVLPQPAEGSKTQFINDVLRYNLQSVKGWGQLVSGCVILMLFGVLLTIILAILLIVFSPVIAIVGFDVTGLTGFAPLASQ